MPDSHIVNQFRGLPMRDLISGPLSAVCQAQTEIAKAAASFIQEVGMDQNGGVRMVEFNFSRPRENATEGASFIDYGEENVSLRVPFLALVNTPNLSIKQVNITFDMEVKETTSEKSSVDSKTTVDTESKFGLFRRTSVKINGSVSTHKENTRNTDNSAKYHVSVEATDTGMTEGLSRVYDILQSAIAPRKIDTAPQPKEAVSDNSAGAAAE